MPGPAATPREPIRTRTVRMRLVKWCASSSMYRNEGTRPPDDEPLPVCWCAEQCVPPSRLLFGDALQVVVRAFLQGVLKKCSLSDVAAVDPEGQRSLHQPLEYEWQRRPTPLVQVGCEEQSSRGSSRTENSSTEK